MYAYIRTFFFSAPLANIKGSAIMNLSTMNNTRILKILINSTIQNIAYKIHGHGLFVQKIFTNNLLKEKKWKKKCVFV